MNTIPEWSDDLTGQVAKYKDEEIILLGGYADEKHVFACPAQPISDVMLVPMNKCEIIHRQANEKLCSPAMRAWMIVDRAEGLRFHVHHALAASVDDNIHSESATEELEYAARDVKKLIEEAKQLEQLLTKASRESPRL